MKGAAHVHVLLCLSVRVGNYKTYAAVIWTHTHSHACLCSPFAGCKILITISCHTGNEKIQSMKLSTHIHSLTCQTCLTQTRTHLHVYILQHPTPTDPHTPPPPPRYSPVFSLSRLGICESRGSGCLRD